MAIPSVEFRSLNISETEPTNRTTAGYVISPTAPLNFGTVNNTAGNVYAGPLCTIFRCTNLQGNTTISNLRFWLSSNNVLVGSNFYYCDITSTWTQNKTAAQVAAGTPGLIPTSVPAANVQKMNGGLITGTDHDNTSQYIYLALKIGADETIGIKGGTGGGFAYSMKFDYA